MLDQKSRLAYYNGLVLPYLDYADIVWGDQPGLKSEMDQLQGFQNKFAKKVLRKNVSSKEALKTPFAGFRYIKIILSDCLLSPLNHDIFSTFQGIKHFRSYCLLIYSTVCLIISTIA